MCILNRGVAGLEGAPKRRRALLAPRRPFFTRIAPKARSRCRQRLLRRHDLRELIGDLAQSRTPALFHARFGISSTLLPKTSPKTFVTSRHAVSAMCA